MSGKLGVDTKEPTDESPKKCCTITRPCLEPPRYILEKKKCSTKYHKHFRLKMLPRNDQEEEIKSDKKQSQMPVVDSRYIERLLLIVKARENPIWRYDNFYNNYNKRQ